MEGPVVGFEFEDFVHLAGPDGTFCDPGGKGFDLCGGKGIAFGRHRTFVIGVGDDFDEEALFWVARNDGGEAGVAAFERKWALVKAEIRFLFVGSVALEAIVSEDGCDLLLKVDGLCRQGGTYDKDPD